MDVFEVIHTTRAMRRLKPDPVPDAAVRKILEAGTAAPSAGNRQQWRFLVVKDAETKRRIQQYYKRALEQAPGGGHRAGDPPPGVSAAEHERRYGRMMQAVGYLTEHFHEAPVWIVACLLGSPDRNTGASIYPAVQNMLLAARALGLGSTLTTRHMAHGAEVDAILGLPADAHSYAILPIGYPLGRFGAVKRAPLEGIVYGDRWGAPAPLAGEASPATQIS